MTVKKLLLLLSLILFSAQAQELSNRWQNTNPGVTGLVILESGDTELEIKNENKHDGAAIQNLPSPGKNQDMVFSASVQSPQPGIAYLSVKLMDKDGKELKRYNSPPNSAIPGILSVSFNTLDADKIQCLLRVFQKPENVGAKVLFKEIMLKPRSRLQTVPGYETCSIYLTSCQAEKAEDFQCEIFYREKGNSDWLPALAPVYDLKEKMARSSIVNLKENTAYEVKLKINDTGKLEEFEAIFQTRTAAVPVAKTITLSKENFKGHLKITDCGTPEGYIRYTAEPGFILQGDGKSGEVILLNHAKYVILDGLTVRGGRVYGIHALNSSDIQILNCDIANFGERGNHRPDIDGKYYYDNGRMITFHAGVYLNRTVRALVERNYIHDSTAIANPWYYSHPSGPTAVFNNAAAELTLRYNDFVGGDTNRWNDAVEGANNGHPEGGPCRDAEIKGNYFVLANDDGIELDGGQMNARVFLNKFEFSLCGVSTAPCIKGPSYLYNNLFSTLGDEFGVAGSAVKNNYHFVGDGRVYILNNTFRGAMSGLSGFGGPRKEYQPDGILKGVIMNNVFATLHQSSIKQEVFQEKSLIAGNLFAINAADKLDAAIKLGFSSGPLQFANPVFDRNSALASDSPGAKSAVQIPNFLPQAGANAGVPSLQFPYRPLNFTVSDTELVFNPSQLTATVSLNPTEANTFRIQQNQTADFFTVTPNSGTLTPGKAVELTITIHPEKLKHARNYRAAFLIRTPEGLSRPVSVSADFSQDTARVKNDRKNVIYATSSKDNSIEFNVTQPGKYYLFLYADNPPYAINLKLDDGKELKGVLSSAKLVSFRWVGVKAESGKDRHAPFELNPGIHRFSYTLRTPQQFPVKAAALAFTPEELLYAPEIE